jgi:hypothetical protein
VTSQQSAQIIHNPAPKPLPAKPDPLRPTDYGVYAISDASLAELQLLPSRAPDIQSRYPPPQMPSRTILPNGHLNRILPRRKYFGSRRRSNRSEDCPRIFLRARW